MEHSGPFGKEDHGAQEEITASAWESLAYDKSTALKKASAQGDRASRIITVVVGDYHSPLATGSGRMSDHQDFSADCKRCKSTSIFLSFEGSPSKPLEHPSLHKYPDVPTFHLSSKKSAQPSSLKIIYIFPFRPDS